MTRALQAAGAILLAATLLGGCVKTCPPTRVSMDELVAGYNANAARADRLWARARIRVELAAEGRLPMGWGSASPIASPNGLLLLRKDVGPQATPSFVLIGRETLAVELFRLGVSGEEGVYYLWYHFGDRGEAWWGRTALAGAPGMNMPLDPAQLLAVLCLTELPADFTDLPTVTLRMSHHPGQTIPTSETCAYILTFLDRQPLSGRIGLTREVYFTWDESAPPRPFLVKLFDRDGVHVLTARLDEWAPIADDAAGPAPTMPTDVELVWEGTVNRLHVQLSEMTTEERGEPEVMLFTPWLPDAIPPGNVIQVDEGLGAEGSQP